MRHVLAFSVVLLTTAIPVSAQRVWPDEGPRTYAPRATEAAITANDLRTRLYQLADDSMMGREAGTLGNWKATEYIAREFRRLGLRPAGENGTYFQEIPYGPLRFDSATVTLAIAGTRLAQGTDWVPARPATNTMIAGKANHRDVATVFGGRYNDTMVTLDPVIVRGKVVVFLAPGAPPQQAAGGGRPTQLFDTRAQRAGAAGILIVTPTISSIALRPTTGMMPTVPAGSISSAQIKDSVAAQLFNAPFTSLAVGTVGKPVTASWEFVFDRPQYPARNVLGALPGSDPVLRGQYVVIGAHNDHVGMVRGNPPEHDSLRAFNRVLRPQGANDRVALDAVTPAQWARINGMIMEARKVRPARLDSVNNGADDDGSGTVVLLEIAEFFASQPAPGRTMIFNSHTAEEKGLLGSRHWTDNPTIPRDSIVAAHNMDMLGKGRVTDVRFGGPASVQMLGSRRLSAEFGDVIDSLNAARDEPMVIDYSWDRTNALNRFCRSDQVSYFRYAIPVTYFSLGYAVDYHQPTDEPQYIDYEHGARVGRFVHEIAKTIANRPNRLKVLPAAERDLSANC